MAYIINSPSILPGKAYTESNSLITGTNAARTNDITVNPSAGSTQVLFAERNQLNYISAQNMNTGGYLCPGQDVINTAASTGTHDKMVGRLAQFNLLGGAVTSALGFEAEIATIGASTTVGSYAGFYLPNLSGVPNIGNVSQLYSFASDHVNSASKNAGRTLNGRLAEIGPAYHPGLVTGRYYTAPYDTLAAQNSAVNILYFVPIWIPHRCTITKLGLTVTTLGAGSARFGLWDSVNGFAGGLSGIPRNRIIDAGTVSVATTGDKEVTISQSVDAGMYFISMVTDVVFGFNWHTIDPRLRLAQYGASGAAVSGSGLEGAAYMPFTYGALPATNSTALTYQAIQNEPHLWFRL